MTTENKAPVLFFVAFIFAMPCFAQFGKSSFCNSNEFAVIRYYKKDTLTITCDTTYLINASAYKLFDNVYRNYKALNTDARKLSALFDDTKTLYENRIREQDEEYEKLMEKYESVLNESLGISQKVNIQLNTVNTSLQQVDGQIKVSLADINAAQEKIRQEMKMSLRKKLSWGVGGMVVGVAATSVIVALVK